jgi:hypothetical protein
VGEAYEIRLDDKYGQLRPFDVSPKGVMHRPRAPQRTVILMVEPATVVPTGDSGQP